MGSESPCSQRSPGSSLSGATIAKPVKPATLGGANGCLMNLSLLRTDATAANCTRRLFFAFLLASILVCALSMEAQVKPAEGLPPNVLTQAVQILNLSPGDSERAHPIQLRGVVTCFDSRARLCFVQDATAGIYVYGENSSVQFATGDLVEVSGVSGAGLFSPIVHWGTFKRIGQGTLPVPKPVSIDRIATGREDSQWVQVEGVIHRANEDWGHLTLDLVAGTSQLKVRILNYPKGLDSQLVDARIRVHGVAGTSYNNKRQLTGFHLLVPSSEHVTIVEPPIADPFSAPIRLSRSLMAYSLQGEREHRIHLRGVVTLHWPGEALFIKDASGGIQIRTRQQTPVEVGEVIDVSGFPAAGGYTPLMEEAIFRSIETNDPPKPRVVTATQALAGEFDKELVRMEGILIAQTQVRSNSHVLVLQNNEAIFHAYVQKTKLGSIVSDLLDGSRLQVTGVCSVDLGENEKPAGFNLWLRSPEDIEVLERPHGRTFTRVISALGAVGLVFCLGLVWIVQMRQRVRHQTEAIRERELALEERYRDLFENANDILYTHDLSGRLTSLNKAGEQVLGYSRAEAVQMNIDDLVKPEQRNRVREQINRKIAGELRANYELEVITKRGSCVALEVTSRPQYQEGKLFGIQGVARDITHRKQAEGALRQSEHQLRKSLEERERIGRDLHDGIIQSIYAVGLSLEDCKRLVSIEPIEVEHRLSKVLNDLNGVIREVRNFILGLESTTLKGLEFKTALRSLVLTLGETHSLGFRVQIDSLVAESLSSNQATHLLHIAREAMSNSVRHAKAERTILALQLHDGAIRFEVQDNGVGFDVKADHPHGLGLRNMAARAQELGAFFTVESQSGQGTRIVLDIPQENPRESALK